MLGLTFAGKWVVLEVFMLNEIDETLKNKLHRFLLMRSSWGGGGGEGRRDVCACADAHKEHKTLPGTITGKMGS